MKILYVEHYDDHVLLTSHLLERRKHQVDIFLPQESLYHNFNAAGLKTSNFDNPAALVDLVRKYDACILNRETFSLNDAADGKLFDSYLNALLASDYRNRIVITTTLIQSNIDKMIPKDSRIRVCEKPFLFNTLEGALK